MKQLEEEVALKTASERRRKELAKFEAAQRQAKEIAKKDAADIVPILEKDPDWPLVSGQKVVAREDEGRSQRAVIRLTRKAVQLLFPQFKIAARHGRGTARWWVHVNIVTPKTPDWRTDYGITQRAERMLLATGLPYGSYSPDYGPGLSDPQPCLSVRLNDLSYRR